jgi:hypothetical protein
MGGSSSLALQLSHQFTLWDLFAFEGGGSRDSCLGEENFEFLVEIINPIPAVTGILGIMRKE